MANPSGSYGITRRGFLLGAATGVAAGAAATWWADRSLPTLWQRLGLGSFRGQPTEVRNPEYAMPGPYPGRVIEVRHRAAVRPDHAVDTEVVDRMIDKGMASLTGTAIGDICAAWGRFFDKEDVVGIKVNPVGRKPFAGEDGRVAHALGCISSPAVLVKVVRCLRELGLPPQNIIVFERYANEFCDAGYADLVERELPGVRWYASSSGYSSSQLDITGFDFDTDRGSVERVRHIAGYDPDVFTAMGYCAPEHSPRDDRRFRSHLSAIVTRMVSKIISLPVLKDHRSAGVTLALKNMSHGMNNNVARSHLSGIAHGFGPLTAHVSGPNQCNTFIPQAAGQHILRKKATLHILDGLVGVYEGGPGSWNRTWGTWHHKGLFFATDPVALDHVGWDCIDEQRARLGWAPVEQMGWIHQSPEVQVTTRLAALAAGSAPQAATLMAAGDYLEGGRASEAFNLRQPEHVILAGKLGLGYFPRELIQHHVIDITDGGPPRLTHRGAG
jgi:hypothetical protein